MPSGRQYLLGWVAESSGCHHPVSPCHAEGPVRLPPVHGVSVPPSFPACPPTGWQPEGQPSGDSVRPNLHRFTSPASCETLVPASQGRHFSGLWLVRAEGRLLPSPSWSPSGPLHSLISPESFPFEFATPPQTLARLRASCLSQAVAGLQPCLPEPGVPQQLPPAPYHQHRVPVDPGPAQGRAGGLQWGKGCWVGRREQEQEQLLDPEHSSCLMAFSRARRWRSWQPHSAPCWHMVSPSSGGSGLSSPYLSRTPQLGYSLSSGPWGRDEGTASHLQRWGSLLEE